MATLPLNPQNEWVSLSSSMECGDSKDVFFVNVIVSSCAMYTYVCLY